MALNGIAEWRLVARDTCPHYGVLVILANLEQAQVQ
jgi:hypothetical protein